MPSPNERKMTALCVQREAAKMLESIIEDVFSYNGERRDDPDCKEEIHYRTLELLLRKTQSKQDWIMQEIEFLEDEIYEENRR